VRGLPVNNGNNYNYPQKQVLEWYELYYEDVYRFVFYMIGDQHSCEDLVHDTFVRAFTSSHRFENRSNVKTWLFGISKHIVLDEIRKRKRRRLFSLIGLEKEIKSNMNIEQQIENKELVKELMTAIQKLKPKHRLVVTLKKIDEFPTKDIAEILGWSEARVRKTLSRALQELKQLTSNGGDHFEQQSV
jgi:RNA polymerase sigma-70 factor, ECF subfamily